MPKNVQTTAQLHSSHILAKECLKFSKRGFNSMWNENFQMLKLDLEKAEDQIANIFWIREKARAFQKNIYFCFIDYTKAFDCMDHNKRWKYQTTRPASWEIYIQVKKQQLEVKMEQRTGSKLGKEYIEAVYCHPVYLTYMQSTSCEMPAWMKHKLESRFLGEI